jgi:hypothetical protein
MLVAPHVREFVKQKHYRPYSVSALWDLLRRRRPNRRSLDLLTEVGTQRERAIIVQLLVTSPAHRTAHSLYLNLSPKFQSFPIGDVRKHKLGLPNLSR